MNAPVLPLSLKTNPRLDRWVRFEADGTVTVFSGKVELGQGIVTAIAQIAAEELDVPLERLRHRRRATPRARPTSGTPPAASRSKSAAPRCASSAPKCASCSSRQAARALRGGAERAARARRRDRTAGHRPAHQLLGPRAAGEPRARRDRRARAEAAPRTTASSAAARRGATSRASSRARRSCTTWSCRAWCTGAWCGRRRSARRSKRSTKRRCGRCPASSPWCAAATSSRVAAEREEQAVKAAEAARAPRAGGRAPALPAQREIAELPAGVAERDAARCIERGRRPAGRGAPVRGDLFQALPRACLDRPVLRAGATSPTARSPSGRTRRARITCATRSRSCSAWPPAQVDVIHRDGAGCYGHNGADDVALDAALLARACGRPVRLQWTREDELAWSPFGSAMVVKIGAGVDAPAASSTGSTSSGAIPTSSGPGWAKASTCSRPGMMDPPLPVPPAKDMPLPAGGGDRNAVPLYDFGATTKSSTTSSPRCRCASRRCARWAPTPTCSRSNRSWTKSPRELGVDPVEFRLRHLKDARARAVIEAAARAAGWGAPLPAEPRPRHRLRALQELSAYCAVVAEVEVAEKIRVRRVFAAVDAGQVVNPDGLVNQIEGGIVQAMSWTLKEEVRWDREGHRCRAPGRTTRSCGFGEVPRDRGRAARPARDCRASAPANAPPARPRAAIANALHDALGVRARDLPLTPERIAQAM